MPDFWRPEVYHPLTVHVPIALLALGALVRIGWVLLPSRQRPSFLLPMARTLLGLGTVAAWAAVLTGEWAYNVVVRQICDPTVLGEHHDAGYATGVIFSLVVLVDIAMLWKPTPLKRWKPWLEGIVALLCAVGLGVLIYAGDLGAKLVYQQGAGVYHPSEACTEWE